MRERNAQILKYLVVPLLFVFGLVVLMLPTFQSIGYYLLIATPAIPYWLTIGAIVGGLLYKFKPVLDISTENIPVVPSIDFSVDLVLGVVIVSLLLAFVIGPMASQVYAKTDTANQINSGDIVIEELPETSEESVRVLPRSVAEVYADSSVQAPQHRLSQADITEVNGTYRWSFALEPDNLMVKMFGNQMGSMYVSMEQANKNVEVVEEEFKYGRGQLFTDSHIYRNVLSAPLEDHQWNTRFDTVHNGKSYTVHSTVTHKWKFRLGPLPQPYAVPQHGTVKITNPDGSIESLSPSAAAEDPRLAGENFYPYRLANFKVNSMKYERGALNKWFWKEGVLSVASLPEGGNSWPLTVPMKASDGSTELTYFTATEPADGGTGVFEVWVIDGQTGEATVQKYDKSQIGPTRAVGAVQSEDAVNRLDDANIISPVPIVKNGQLYWHTKVVPSSRNGVIATAFVNATNKDVTVVEGTEQVYAFLTEEEVDELEDAAKPNGGMEVTVVVKDSNGDKLETKEITVPEGGDFDVSVSDKTSDDESDDDSSSETTTG